MYYEHFGLTQAPFKITPNTDFFFSGGNRGPVLEALIYAITHGEGIVKVSGEVGSGKTMLCNMLQNRLPPNVESVYLANPSVAPEDVLHAIAFELGLGVDRHADRLEVMHALQDYLVQQHAAGQRVVVFIEESQSMPVATLEEIRLLSNLETRNDKLLQMVLFGQPELDEILRRPDIRQLRDRIAHSFRLEPLTDEQVREYLSFRMRAAGYRGPDIFSPAVVRQIARASSGLTRRINLIADKALLAAFAENTHTIEARHVNAALRDSEFGQPQLHARPALRYAWIGLGLIAGTVFGAGLYALVDSRTGAPSPAAIPPSQAAPDATAPASADPPAAPAAVPAPTPRAATAEATTSGAAVETPAAPAPDAALPAAQASSGPPFPPEQTLKPSGDLIADRIHATQNWLNSGASRPFSIQLLVTSNEEQLRNHLKALTKFVEVNDVYMYRSVAHGKPAVSVLWGTYDTLKAAEAHMEELPRHLRANRPYIRSIEGIRAEVNRNTVTR